MIDRRIVKYKARRGTETQRLLVTFDEGELIYTTDSKKLYVGDGITVGGSAVANRVFSTSYSSPGSAIRAVNDLLYRPDLGKFYIADASQWVYVGPYADEQTITFNNNQLALDTGGISAIHLSTTVAQPSGGLAVSTSGVYVYYDSTKFAIDSLGRLTFAGILSSPLDASGGLTTTINGVKVNVDGTTLVTDPALSGNKVHVGVVSASNIASGAVGLAKLGSDVVQLSGGVVLGVSGLKVDYNTTTMVLSNGQVSVNPSYISSAQTVPAGTIIYTAMSAAPAGYLAADGSAVSRTTYAALFAAIDSMYGSGNGSTTFNLPDLRGYFIRGSGTNGDGTASGDRGSRQADSIASHTHTTIGSVQTGYTYTAKYGASAYLNTGTGNTGATGNTETRPKNIALIACIKY